MVQKDSNKLRLTALENKKTYKSEQTDIIRKALSVTPANNIVRFSDSDDDTEKNTKQSDILYDVEDVDAEVLFADKPHFFGKKGEKLMTLQTKIGSDDRFQLDNRFESESDSEDETEQDEEQRELENERRSQHHVMNSILETLGMKVYKPVPIEHNQIVDNYVRFDPTDVEHEKYLINSAVSASEAEINASSKATEDGDPTSDEINNGVTDIDICSQSNNPIVDEKSFFEIKADFNKSITSENTSGGFKFGFSIDNLKSDSSERCDPDVTEIKNYQIKELQLYDSSDDEGILETAIPSQSSSSNIPSQSSSSKSLSNSFFYTLNPKFKEESAINFKRTKTMDEIEKEWLSQRQQLTAEYKKRHKDALRFQKKLISKS